MTGGRFSYVVGDLEAHCDVATLGRVTIKGAQYGFHTPDGITSDGTHVWVTNTYGESVIEIDASSGKFVQLLKGAKYGFAAPGGIAIIGTHVWVANHFGGPITRGSMTELDLSTGQVVRVIGGYPPPTPTSTG